MVKDRLPAAELGHFFPTPILEYTWPDVESLNDELSKIILEKERQDKGKKMTNIGGWQSSYDFLDWEYEPVSKLKNMYEQMFHELVHRTVDNINERHLTNWKYESWACINRKGNFNVAHDHSMDGNIFSGIYYIRVDDSSKRAKGRTFFQDRSHVPIEILNDSNPFRREESRAPVSGQMIIFPGSLYHYVEKYMGDGVRIVVPANALHDGFTTPRYENHDFYTRNFRGFVKLWDKIRGHHSH